MASELNGAERFTELQIFARQQDNSTWGNLEWSICHTSLSQLTTDFNDNYDGNTPLRVYYKQKHLFKFAANQWTGFPFDTAFVYDGTSNLVLETRFNEKGEVQNGWGTWRAEKRTIDGSYTDTKGDYIGGNAVTTFRLIYDATGVKVPVANKKQAGLTHYFDPCGSSVGIKFTLQHAADVNLKVYDVCGTLIRELMHERKDTGTCLLKWDTGNRTVSAD